MLDDLDLDSGLHPVQKKILKASIALKSETAMAFVFQCGQEQLIEDLAEAEGGADPHRTEGNQAEVWRIGRSHGCHQESA